MWRGRPRPRSQSQKKSWPLVVRDPYRRPVSAIRIRVRLQAYRQVAALTHAPSRRNYYISRALETHSFPVWYCGSKLLMDCMSDLPPNPQTEILPPESRALSVSTMPPVARRFVIGLSASALLTLLLWVVNEFTSIRGIVSVVGSRIILVFGWIILVVLGGVLAWGTNWPKKKTVAIIVWSLLWAAILLAIDYWAPRPTPAPKPPAPLVTLQISPAGFPVSVPAHTTLSILPLHPFQTFGGTSTQPHIFDNSCGEEHLWPSREEIDSKPPNAYEEVRRVEVTNHSQRTVAAGQLEFGVLYNDPSGVGCMPPSNFTPTQKDVISIPTLDAGKSFDFVVVNQTNRCAWLILPDTITAKVGDDERGTGFPLALEPINIPNWPSTPFAATSVKWQGVPIKNPGYGLVRSGAECQPPNDTEKRKAILAQLGSYVSEGSKLQIMLQRVACDDQSSTGTRLDDLSRKIGNWHRKAGTYIGKELGQSYLDRFHNQTKPPSSWPCFLVRSSTIDTYALWNGLSSDRERLDEFMGELETGR